MNKLIAFCIIAATAASAAHAQISTFQSKETSNDAVGGARTDGTSFGGQVTTGTSETVAADGTKSSGTYKCMGVTMPPNDTTYNARIICDNVSAEGATATIWGCTMPDKVTKEIYCTGWAFGKSGIYAGRRGTMTFRGLDGKGVGTALWGK
jgi:molybdopterin/thiamine biosynthesis adenylyltransferase